MDAREPVLIAWSGGKDCTLALHALLNDGRYDVVALLTTVTLQHDRVTMHGVRRQLLEEQAHSLGYPLRIVEVPATCSNVEYQERMSVALLEFRAMGIRSIVHGDIFLEDVRRYREEMLSRIDLKPIFPIWGLPSGQLAARFTRLGYRAVLTCVDTQVLDAAFAGRSFDAQLIAELPDSVDPCGENGEFHTFVFDGPLFRLPLTLEVGEVVLRDERFAFCDLLPMSATRAEG